MAENGEKKQESKKNVLKVFGKIITSKVFWIIVVICVTAGVGYNIKDNFFTESKTTKLGFEDIGELATQAAYTTNVSVIDESKDIWGMQIPFTQSKYIFTYDTVIKAGLDFSAISWDVNDENKVITVRLPEIKVLSNELDTDSLEVFHEQQSIFTHVSLEDINAAQSELKNTAQETAIQNGLMDNALDNAKTLLTSYIGQVYDLDEYTLEFVTQGE